ncbi:uncharacterized protein LOC100898369 [Galendromus occidentalis]|uniref:Uncharacterized protein LOC100898369 n=1 Tax=Galendromus occidentalis TaxID=34638 RepID=A0AAJ6VZ70_9ACAR|nr:uncharacterized protein LOC100898369 [Galendromus occidentalis]
MLRSWLIVLLLCYFAYGNADTDIRSSDEVTRNETDLSPQKYGSCPPGYFNVNGISFLEFYDYKTAKRTTWDNPKQIQCVNSTLCTTSGAKIDLATCKNADRGLSSPKWFCTMDFYGSGFKVVSSNITCEYYRLSSICALQDSCVFFYAPSRSQSRYVLAGFGALVLIAIAALAVCVWMRSRNSSMNSGRTTTTFISTPSPAYSHAQQYPSGQVYPEGMYHAPSRYPPPPYTHAPYGQAPLLRAPHPHNGPEHPYSPPEPPKVAPY